MTDLSEKSGSKVAQKKRGRGRDSEYWKKRLVRRAFVHEGKRRLAKDWSVRIQHAGKRQFFNLETANRSTAAARAKERYEFVKAHGWQAAEAEFKHADETARVKAEKEALTVGGYLAKVAEVATRQEPRTLQVYGSCLRRVVGEIIAGGTGAKVKRDQIDATPLASITAHAVEKWKSARLRKCDGNPIQKETAETTINSILRQCRAVFGRKLVPKLRQAGVKLPEPLPFSGVDLFSEDTSGKFEPQVDPAELVRAAATELDGPRKTDENAADFAARQQCYLAFVLAFAAGLRKGEADTLQWSAVDLDAGKITVATTEFFKPKTRASKKPVQLDPETVKILRGFRARFPKDRFVLRSDMNPRPGIRYSFYRAKATWNALGKWLLGQGVTDPKPIHYCRKAITALMAKRYGIFAAQRHARHTTPQVTARFYSDSEDSIAPGIGEFFNRNASDDGKKILSPKFGEAESEASKNANG